MKSFKKFLKEYRGEHQAPMKEDGSPLYDLTLNGIYPEDVYSKDGFRYYGVDDTQDREAYSILLSAKGKPDKRVKIYRAVPLIETNAEKISALEDAKKTFLRRGNVPSKFSEISEKDFYDWACDEIERLEGAPESEQPQIKINEGDWVTIVRQYAVDHGKRTLNGKYKILSKTVKASELFTNGDSWLEWGWSP